MRIDRAGEAVAVAHGVEQAERVAVDVGEHELRVMLGEEVQRVLAVLGDQDLVAVSDELIREKRTSCAVVLDDEDQVWVHGGLL